MKSDSQCWYCDDYNTIDCCCFNLASFSLNTDYHSHHHHSLQHNLNYYYSLNSYCCYYANAIDDFDDVRDATAVAAKEECSLGCNTQHLVDSIEALINTLDSIISNILRSTHCSRSLAATIIKLLC